MELNTSKNLILTEKMQFFFEKDAEVRIAICIALIIEVLFNGLFLYFAILSTLILFIANIKDILQIIKLADLRDKEEKTYF